MQLTGNILTEDRLLFGSLTIENDIITAIKPLKAKALAKTPYIMPGFIDLHVHGGGGADIMDGGNAVAIIARTHAGFGTTSFLPTTMTASKEDIIHALKGIAAVMQNPQQGADIIGVHLEGPFINPAKLGAQPNHILSADRVFIRDLNAIAPLRIITLAPEFPENMDIIAWLTEQNIRTQIGHSLADYGQCLCAMQKGASGFTHLYNAMSPLHHRAAGAVGAALAHSLYCEIIPDLIHTDEGALRAAMRAIPRLYGITDGTAACGMPDGRYRLGENPVYRKGNAVRLKDGTLVGSVLTLDQAFRNFIKLGDSIIKASQRLSSFQADYLGLKDRGRLQPGLRADIITMDSDFKILTTIIGGKYINDKEKNRQENAK